MYKALKPLLFKFDPEHIHDIAMSGLSWSSRHPGALRLIESICNYNDPRLETTLFGLRFPNPIGLAAGFDKNARAIPSWLAMGFGYLEVGSVTMLAQAGNPKPRLFRLADDGAIINRMGFNNDGAQQMAMRLETLFETYGKPAAPLGINLGKSKLTPIDNAPEDYLHSLKLLYGFGDYFVVNVSSPNTPGLRSLQHKDKLELLLDSVTGYAHGQDKTKPILLKIAPDLSHEQIDEILELALSYQLAGIIATNTTVSRDGLSSQIAETGGLSGEPLKQTSLSVLKYISEYAGKELAIISVGGISSVEDVYTRLSSGASLVQLYSSLIYQGPLLLKRLNKGLSLKLEHTGFKQLQDMLKS